MIVKIVNLSFAVLGEEVKFGRAFRFLTSLPTQCNTPSPFDRARSFADELAAMFSGTSSAEGSWKRKDLPNMDTARDSIGGSFFVWLRCERVGGQPAKEYFSFSS